MKTGRLDTKMSIFDFLSVLVKDKEVLDVGCVEHSAEAEASEFWMHRHLVRGARSVLGVDILESDVEELRSRGYNIVCADATTDWLGRKFDIVFAGEVIEHVVNPGGLLSNLRRHLKDDGRLMITTPNPFYALNGMVPVFSWERRFWNPDHVAWYCPYTLASMFRKTGYEMESCYYFTRSRKLRRLLRTLHIPSFGILSMSIVAIAKPAA
jgi:2-polyprenyl-3-methyl-5-hydroxy-6-metoxy-1,4-benzoquinol methylase